MSGDALDEVPVPAADIATEIVEGEVLLYHPAQTRAIYLNPSAAVIWGLCDGRRSVREIVRVVGESYPDAGAELTEDVTTVVRQLRESGVLAGV
jgi:hypothetical protein